MKDFAVTLRLKNNRLKARRVALGLNQGQVAVASGVGPHVYGRLENLSMSPKRLNGEWRTAAVRLADYHKTTPEDLFPESVQRVERNVVERTFDIHDLPPALVGEPPLTLPSPDDVYDGEERRATVLRMLEESSLTERELQVVRMRFGIRPEDHEHTYEEVGARFEVTRECIRQIEAKALRKLRHPRNHEGVKVWAPIKKDLEYREWVRRQRESKKAYDSVFFGQHHRITCQRCLSVLVLQRRIAEWCHPRAVVEWCCRTCGTWQKSPVELYQGVYLTGDEHKYLIDLT